MTGDPFVEACTALGGNASDGVHCFIGIPQTKKWLLVVGKMLGDAMEASRKAGRYVSWVFIRSGAKVVELEYIDDATYPFALTVKTRTSRSTAPVDGRSHVGTVVRERVGSSIVTGFGWTWYEVGSVAGYGMASIALSEDNAHQAKALLPRIARVASRAARKALARYEKGLGPDAAALPPVFVAECQARGGKVVFEPDEVLFITCHVGAEWLREAVRMARTIYRALVIAGIDFRRNLLPATPILSWKVIVRGEEDEKEYFEMAEVAYSPYTDEWEVGVWMEGHTDPGEVESWAPARRVRVIHNVEIEATATIREDEEGGKMYEVEAVASLEGEIDARDLERLVAATVDEAREAYYDMIEG